jgi:hypothetical protein
MKTGMYLYERRKIEIVNVDGERVRQLTVVLPRSQTSRVFSAPVEKAAPSHVLLVTQLHLNICPGAVLQYRSDSFACIFREIFLR